MLALVDLVRRRASNPEEPRHVREEGGAHLAA
jgi:hypothetical protein